MDLVTISKLLLLSGCISHVVADPKVVSMPISRSAKRTASLAKRANSTAVTLDNQGPLYSINVTVGTPGQPLTLDVDTGSSDIWFFNPAACTEAQCVAGEFDPTKSSTYSLLVAGEFEISYADNSGAKGDYISDVINLGGGLEISNQTMALATSATDNKIGLFGIAYRSNEAGQADYPTIVDEMVDAGLIKSRAYSLWLDDLQASTGTLLFGGYDPDQYVGDLTVLSIQPDVDSGRKTSFTVDLSAMALTDGSGSTTLLHPDEFPLPVVLDSGTSLTTLPADTFYTLAEYFGATLDQQSGGYVVSCDIANWKGTLDYGFGGSDGTIIQVPFAELAINYGDSTCQFGLDIASDSILIGDTFLRSAYVVYDMDSDQIAIAQSKWGSETSNPVEISSDDDLVTLIQGSRDATSASVPDETYESLSFILAGTATPTLDGSPMTASVSGAKTSFSVVAAPTETVKAASTSKSTGGGSIQTAAAYILPMALPLAAALL